MAALPCPLQFNLPSLRPGQLVLEAFPALASMPEMVAHGHGGNDRYLRLAIWYADMGSEYRGLPLDLKKQQCLERAGIEAADPRRAGFLAWTDAGLVAMVNAYVRFQSSLEYALWFHGTESAWQTVEQLSIPITGGEMDDAKIQSAYKGRRDNLDAMFVQVPKLEQLGDRLFMGDEELKSAVSRSLQQNTPTAERRAEGRSFIPRVN